ncbi:MAG: competence protein CoiA [Candidatus Hodarchaeales archaeon]|jgi:hypothetical protein
MIYANLGDIRIKTHRNLTRKTKYLCPDEYCKNRELILKKGRKRIPHFSHKQGGESCLKYSEPETDSHIAMKCSIQETLNIDGKFMEYTKIKGVKPDILWNEKFAIEVQHSSISAEEIERRNKIYFENNLVPIWIFHMDEWEDLAYYQRGKYCKWHTYDDSLRLKLSERYVSFLQGGLLYIGFDSDFMIPCEEEGYEEDFSIKFDNKNGASLFFYKIKRVENKKSLFDYKHDAINTSDLLGKIVDKIETNLKNSSILLQEYLNYEEEETSYW